MTQQPDAKRTINAPLMDTEHRPDLAADALVHQYLTQVQNGSLHPDRIPVNTMERVLDLGCGSGDWIFDLAKRYPRLHIFGVDVNEEALNSAKVRRNMSSLRQVELRQMDITRPLAIPDQYLDFVHMRRGSRFVRPSDWPRCIRECVRVLKPGGWLAIVEQEFFELSSPACLTLQRTLIRAKRLLGHTMDTTDLTHGVAVRLYGMLLQTQLEEVAYDLHAIDLGFMGGYAAQAFLTQMVRVAVLAKPLVVQQGVLDAATFDDLIVQASAELQAPDLCGWGILVSAYGRKARTKP